MCEFFDKDIKYPKWSCVLNCCSECPGVFVPNAETNCDQDVGLPFIHFNRYKNIGYFYLNKNLLSEHCKTCTSWINLEILGKERLKHGNIRNWKFWFSFNTVLHPWKKIVHVNVMTYLWVDTIRTTTNTHMIIKIYVRFWVEKFTLNSFLVVSQFLWRVLRLISFTNWNHKP